MSKSQRIAYLDGRRIRRGLRAGARHLMAGQEHLNKINVYPVPDGDTGTNMALTIGSVLTVVAEHPSRHAGQVLTDVADAALDGARGNSGAILAQFFQGVSDSVSGLTRVSVTQFATAVSAGEQYARDALAAPVEGTVITVMRDFARRISDLASGDTRDFVTVLEQGLKTAIQSLAQTPQQLEALRKAGVVDAGAEGFVRLITGIYYYIEGGDLDEALPEPKLEAGAQDRSGV